MWIGLEVLKFFLQNSDIVKVHGSADRIQGLTSASRTGATHRFFIDGGVCERPIRFPEPGNDKSDATLN
jgi:hypothetical protein